MSYEEKILRAKRRIEYLRKIHGLRKQDICKGLGFSKAYYHKSYLDSPKLSLKSLIGITSYLGVSEYDLIHATEDEFNNLPIVDAYLYYSQALKEYEKLKLGIWVCEPFIENPQSESKEE